MQGDTGPIAKTAQRKAELSDVGRLESRLTIFLESLDPTEPEARRFTPTLVLCINRSLPHAPPPPTFFFFSALKHLELGVLSLLMERMEMMDS